MDPKSFEFQVKRGIFGDVSHHCESDNQSDRVVSKIHGITQSGVLHDGQNFQFA